MTFAQNTEVCDDALVRRFQAGDKASAAVLFVRYTPLLHRSAGRCSLPACDYEDIYQEACIGFLSALRAYEPQRGASFMSFARVCVENRLKNFAAAQRSQKMSAYRSQLSLEALNENGGDFSDDKNPESIYLSKEQVETFYQDVNSKLSPLERDILILYLCGNNYKFIASKMGIPYKSVDNALQRVRRKLKSLTV